MAEFAGKLKPSSASRTSPLLAGRPKQATTTTAPAGALAAGFRFGAIPLFPSHSALNTVTRGASGGERSKVIEQRHTFSASIRRVQPSIQRDGMSAEEHEPAPEVETPDVESPLPLWEQPARANGAAVLFSHRALKPGTLPDQTDKVASTFAYKGSLNQDGLPPAPGEFGTTRPFYAFEPPGPSAVQANGTFDVTGTILGRITYQIAAPPNHKDITSDSDPDITQTNYPTVASDLTPSPTNVNSGGVKLYKNQPRRSKFWASDLTIKHERFHGLEDIKFGQEGVTQAQNWLNRQSAQTYDDVGRLLNRVTSIVSAHVDLKMALPGRELRAYEDGAPSYQARAQAIKRKGDAKGFVPQRPAPTQQAPTTPPNPTRKPAPPPSPASNKPATR